MRTQSGSLIPELSKQPTPAPSSPDIEHNDYDVFGDPVILEDAGHLSDLLASPSGTPNTRLKEAALVLEVEKYKELVKENEKIAKDREKALNEKVCSFHPTSSLC
jgi:hypothetical protein